MSSTNDSLGGSLNGAPVARVPGDGPAPERGKCIKTGKPSARRVLFAEAY